MTADNELVLTPERFANGGESVARLDGRVIFIRGAIPGEAVRVRVTDTRRDSFWRAQTLEVLEPSAHRQDPACAAAAAGAGCCDLAYIAVEHARDLKAGALREVLARVGGITDIASAIDPRRIDPDGAEADATGTGWRIRARYRVDEQGRPGMTEAGGAQVLGGIACAAPTARLWQAVMSTRYRPGAEVAAMQDADGQPHVVEIAPVEDRATGTRSGSGRRAAQQARRRREAPRVEDVVVGHAQAVQRVGAREWRIPVSGFWQAHRGAPGAYAATVVDAVQRYASEPVAVCWDLYGGAGVFAAALRDGPAATADIHVVESSAAALAAAETTFLGDDRLHLHRGQVERLTPDLPAPDVVVLDPPRIGADRDVIEQIVAAAPSTVIHVGCDAARFARDLSLFVERGYQVRDITSFDAFPLTHHIEAIAVLTGP